MRSGVYDDAVGVGVWLSCLANGTTKAISEIQVGDEVLATDPATGETTARTVTKTHVMLHDGDLLDVTIEDDDGEGVIQTTDRHPFWSVTDGEWESAIELSVGEQLRRADGMTATVVKLTERPGRQDMHDLTVEVDHNFYVDFGRGSVLVHNAGGGNDANSLLENYVYVIRDAGGNVYKYGISSRPMLKNGGNPRINEQLKGWPAGYTGEVIQTVPN